MGHAIEYLRVPRDTDKKKIIAEIDEYVTRECWQEGGRYSGGHLTWHENDIYDDEQAAVDAIDNFDRGWYDDHAVLFYNTDKLESAATRKIEKQITDTQKKRSDYIDAHHVKNRKSAYVGCPKCGSKLSREHLHTDTCPLCREDLRSETVKARIAGYDEKIETLREKLRGEKAKLVKKAPVMWLVKFEYHI